MSSYDILDLCPFTVPMHIFPPQFPDGKTFQAHHFLLSGYLAHHSSACDNMQSMQDVALLSEFIDAMSMFCAVTAHGCNHSLTQFYESLTKSLTLIYFFLVEYYQSSTVYLEVENPFAFTYYITTTVFSRI